MITKDEKEKYDLNYQKQNMKHFSFWLNKKKDADLIEWLNQNGKGGASRHIKAVLRNAMTAEKQADK